jgi:glycosyltransferase involved in cell wall biosynthesis
MEVQPATRTLRINYVMSRPSLGGGTKSTKLIAEAMVRRGHDVRIIYVNKRRPLPHPWRLRTFMKAVVSRLSGTDSLTQHHLHNSSATLMPVLKLHIEADDVPDADVTIGSWWETMEWIDRLPESKGLKVHYVRGNEVFVKERDRERVRGVYRMPHLKATISVFLQKVMAQEYGKDAVVIPNGVDKAQFQSEPRPKNAIPRVGLVIGAHRLKGAHTAFEACRIVQQALPELQVVGFGMEPLSPRQMPPANFHFHVRPSQQEIPNIYRSCDCWIVPSVSEGLAMPGLEAAACRCPVVATRCGGAEDYVQDAVNGYLVPVEDPSEMARRLKDVLMLDEAGWREMSEASYRVARTFDWDISAGILEKTLVDALEARSK